MRILRTPSFFVGLACIFCVTISLCDICHAEAPEEGSSPEWNEQERININTAFFDDLMNIEGMTQENAEMILEERDTNGPFESLADLSIRIRGIGPTTVIKWKNAVVE